MPNKKLLSKKPRTGISRSSRKDKTSKKPSPIRHDKSYKWRRTPSIVVMGAMSAPPFID